MTNDLDLVKQLQEEIGREFRQVPLEKIGKDIVTAFAADSHGQVKGLSIFHLKLNRVPVVLSQFQRLEKLWRGFPGYGGHQ